MSGLRASRVGFPPPLVSFDARHAGPRLHFCALATPTSMAERPAASHGAASPRAPTGTARARVHAPARRPESRSCKTPRAREAAAASGSGEAGRADPAGADGPRRRRSHARAGAGRRGRTPPPPPLPLPSAATEQSRGVVGRQAAGRRAGLCDAGARGFQLEFALWARAVMEKKVRCGLTDTRRKTPPSSDEKTNTAPTQPTPTHPRCTPAATHVRARARTGRAERVSRAHCA